MIVVRMYANTEEAETVRQRLESKDTKASADLVAADTPNVEATLSDAGVADEEISKYLEHVHAGRVLLLIHVGALDMLRLNDLLGPDSPADVRPGSGTDWQPGTGTLEDAQGRTLPRKSGL
jgi:hypothetical protein